MKFNSLIKKNYKTSVNNNKLTNNKKLNISQSSNKIKIKKNNMNKISAPLVKNKYNETQNSIFKKKVSKIKNQQKNEKNKFSFDLEKIILHNKNNHTKNIPIKYDVNNK